MRDAGLFASPGGWPLLLLAPAAWLLLLLLDRLAARRLARIVGPRVPALARERDPRRRATRRALFALALLGATVAALGPLARAGSAAAPRRGADLVFCLDVSRSMLARDLDPDRLGRAKAELAALAGRARGDRLALLLFAGEARPLVPLTEDAASFAELLAGADPWSVRRGGTDLGAAVDAALALLEGATGAHEAIVLLTDGEDLSGSGLEAARRARARGIAVHAVGFGTELGSKIPVDGGFLRDPLGAEVVSRLEPSSLRRLAGETGGLFLDASKEKEPLRRLYDGRLAAIEGRRVAGEPGRETLFQWPLLLALGLFLAESALGERRRT